MSIMYDEASEMSPERWDELWKQAVKMKVVNGQPMIDYAIDDYDNNPKYKVEPYTHIVGCGNCRHSYSDHQDSTYTGEKAGRCTWSKRTINGAVWCSCQRYVRRTFLDEIKEIARNRQACGCIIDFDAIKVVSSCSYHEKLARDYWMRRLIETLKLGYELGEYR